MVRLVQIMKMQAQHTVWVKEDVCLAVSVFLRRHFEIGRAALKCIGFMHVIVDQIENVLLVTRTRTFYNLSIYSDELESHFEQKYFNRSLVVYLLGKVIKLLVFYVWM